MNTLKKLKRYSKLPVSAVIVCFMILKPAAKLFAEDKKATIQVSFFEEDSTKKSKATVMSEGAPIKDKEVHFYVKRTYSLLPIGKPATTDEKGEASIAFPTDLPGDKDGNITVIAKIEEDDILGTVEAKADVKWGVLPELINERWSHRSLSASREKAPTFLIIASNAIIAVIWGTIIYVIFQVFRIRRESKPIANK